MTARLVASDLVAGYGKVEVLHGLSLRVDPGETVAIVGANGAGKTTLLRAVFGFLRPASGSILLDGHDIRAYPPHAMAEVGLAMVPDDRGIFRSLTVGQNLRLSTLGSAGVDPARIEEIHSLFPVLGERKGSVAGTLSGGQQQMLGLARALMSGPSLLLLDEPSLGLAPKAQDDLFEALGSLASRGMSILLVEQNVRRALSIASRAYLVRDGRVAMEAPARDVLKDGRLLTAYLGKPAEALAEE